MAERPNRDPQTEDEPSTEAGPATARHGLVEQFLTRKALMILLIVSVAVHVIGFSYYKLTDSVSVGEEVSLGKFHFAADHPGSNQVAEASFSLHLALLGELNVLARERIEARTFRVQQDVEQLLRRAHGADFDDPVLAELKQQLQEQINRTLELRAIAEVIITDLDLRRTPDSLIPSEPTPGPPPWDELSAR